MRKLLGATLLSVALAVGVAGGPAHAVKSTTVADNPNDAYRGIDVRKVTIVKAPASAKVRTVFSHFGRNNNGMQYYFDTVRARKGPEYTAFFFRDKDGDGVRGVRVYKLKSWNEFGAEVTCTTQSHWKMRSNGTGVFTARLGYRCMELAGKKRFRAAVRSWDFTKYSGQGSTRTPTFGHTDWMKDKRTYSRWLV